MPILLTEKYKDRTFRIPLNENKSEYVDVRPMTESVRSKIKQEVYLSSGADQELAEKSVVPAMLKHSIVGWAGFKDVGGNEIPCTHEAIQMLCEHESEYMSGLFFRIMTVARQADLIDEKN